MTRVTQHALIACAATVVLSFADRTTRATSHTAPTPN